MHRTDASCRVSDSATKLPTSTPGFSSVKLSKKLVVTQSLCMSLNLSLSLAQHWKAKAPAPRFSLDELEDPDATSGFLLLHFPKGVELMCCLVLLYHPLL